MKFLCYLYISMYICIYIAQNEVDVYLQSLYVNVNPPYDTVWHALVKNIIIICDGMVWDVVMCYNII